MRPPADPQVLVFEMHVLLGPLTFLVGAAPLGLLLGPVLHRDAGGLALFVGVVAAMFALSTAWSLGRATMRGEPYRFDGRFWPTVHGTLVAAALIGTFADPRAVALFVPLWVFMAHMGWLQRRLRGS